MRSWKTPTPEQLNHAIALIAHPEQRRHFFDRLQNPLWAKLLAERGIFASPPAPVGNLEEGYMHPVWPELQYLARVADGAPGDALEILLALPETDNIRVHHSAFDVALKIPAEMAEAWVAKELPWIEKQSRLLLLLPEKAADLVVHLADHGRCAAALDLATATLAVTAERDDSRGAVLRTRPASRVDEWTYARILEKVRKPLVAACGDDALTLLLTLLCDAVVAQLDPDAHPPDDFSYIWRSDIGSDERDDAIVDALVSAVRDAAVSLAQMSDDTSSIVTRLESFRWHIFIRLALHLLTVRRSADIGLRFLLDGSLWLERAVRREHLILFREVFPLLALSEKESVLALISEGPGESIPQSIVDAGGERDYVARWIQARLLLVADALPSRWQEQLPAAGETIDASEIIPGRRAVEVFSGDQSPFTEGEIRSWSIPTLIERIQAWAWSGDPWGPTPRGLGHRLTASVTDNPSRWTEDLDAVRTLDPTYVRSVLEGFCAVLRDGRSIEWQSILRLCSWVVERPRDVPGREHLKGQFEVDANWSGSRLTIARILQAGFGDIATAIPPGYRHIAWAIVRALTDDPDPSQEAEGRYRVDGEVDPSMISINTVRGEAMHAAVGYGLWCRRQLPAEDQLRGFCEIPELRLVLDEHLSDNSIGVRAVYGRWIPQLVLLDSAWVSERKSQIFPHGEGAESLRNAAWISYVTGNPPYDSVVSLLLDEYSRAIDALASGSAGRVWERAVEQLAEHTVLLYLRGQAGFEGVESLTGKLFESSDRNARYHAIWFGGRLLDTSSKESIEPVVSLFRSLWSWHVGRVAADPHLAADAADEISAFGWWFASGYFATCEDVRLLAASIGVAGKLVMGGEVLRVLAALMRSYPAEVLDAVAALVAAPRILGEALGWEAPMSEILGLGLASDKGLHIERSRSLVNQLGAKGYRQFGGLLP